MGDINNKKDFTAIEKALMDKINKEIDLTLRKAESNLFKVFSDYDIPIDRSTQNQINHILTEVHKSTQRQEIIRKNVVKELIDKLEAIDDMMFELEDHTHNY